MNTPRITPLEITAHKELAAAVLLQALADLKNCQERDAARRFLTDAGMAPMRQIWLAWLDQHDDGFQNLIALHQFQGATNRTALTAARPS